MVSTLLAIYYATYSIDPFDIDVLINEGRNIEKFLIEWLFLFDMILQCFIEYVDNDNKKV